MSLVSTLARTYLTRELQYTRSHNAVYGRKKQNVLVQGDTRLCTAACI